MRLIAVLVAVMMAFVMTIVVLSAHALPRFPHGRSHCCIVAIAMALEQYAETNGGIYPRGERCPEASLGLLFRSDGIDADTLRGITVPEDKVRAVLASGGTLDPDTCGWHYVEGLTRADDHRIAMLYCKEALGHNGQQTDGGRQVVFVGGLIEWVAGDQWAAFITDQDQLLDSRSDAAKTGLPLVTARIELPGGGQIESIPGQYMLSEQKQGPGLSSNSDSSGTNLSTSSLSWYRAPLQFGSISRILSFSDLVSDPVTIEFVNGRPDRTTAIFKMRSATGSNADE